MFFALFSVCKDLLKCAGLCICEVPITLVSLNCGWLVWKPPLNVFSHQNSLLIIKSCPISALKIFSFYLPWFWITSHHSSNNFSLFCHGQTCLWKKTPFGPLTLTCLHVCAGDWKKAASHLERSAATIAHQYGQDSVELGHQLFKLAQLHFNGYVASGPL